MLDKTLELCKKLDLAMCVCSSHGYKDMWDLFFYYWNKNLSQYKIPVYFLTSEKIENTNSSYNVIYPKLSKSSDPWSNRIQECLEQINHRNIITTTEDAIINTEFDPKKFFSALNHFNNNDLDYLKISPFYPNRSKEKIDTFVSHADWELHRVNITKAIWKKKSLLKLFKKDESSGEFDMFASKRAKEKNMNIQHCDFNALPYVEIIHGGKLNYSSKKILNEFRYFERYDREFNSRSEILVNLLKSFKLYIYSILPINIKKLLIKNKIIGNHQKFLKNYRHYKKKI